MSHIEVILYEKSSKFGGTLKWQYRANPEIESGKCVETRWKISLVKDNGIVRSAVN